MKKFLNLYKEEGVGQQNEKNHKIKRSIREVRHKNCIYVDSGTLQLEKASRSPKRWNANNLTEVNRDELCMKNDNSIFHTLHIRHWAAAGDMKEVSGKTVKSIKL